MRSCKARSTKWGLICKSFLTGPRLWPFRPRQTKERLHSALQELGIPADQVVGIGDAENDEAFLGMCGLYTVVANALPPLKQAADLVSLQECGPGVVEIIEKIMASQLSLLLLH